jgi:hypothetical protein
MPNRYPSTGPGDVLCPECQVHLTDATHKFCTLCGAPVAGPPHTEIRAEIAIALARAEADKCGDPIH